LLWALKHGASVGIDAAQLPVPPRQGLTSVGVDKDLPEAFYRAAGFQVCGPRAIRIDMLERLADLIRPLTSWKANPARPEPPLGAVGRGGFKVQPEMLSIIGCSAEEMGNVLFVLGFRKERRLVQAQPAASVDAPVADAASMISEAPAEAVLADGHAELADGAEMILQDLGQEAAVAPEIAASSEPVASSEIASNGQAESVETVAAAAPELAASAADVPELAATSGAAASEAAAEPEYEDIWRPRRRVQVEERRPPNRKPEQNRDRRRTDARPAAASETTPAAPAAAAPEAVAERAPRRDQDRNRDNNNNRRRDDRRGGDDRRGDERRGGGKGRPDQGGVRTATAAPARRGKDVAADPDSPFAALLKLKERMARGAQDQA
jgi:ATP-dependent RNA helicase SUPV3L1/SUV3